MTSHPVHIIVTCTNRKLRTIPPELHLRSLTELGTAARFDAWIRRLATAAEPAVAADRLYAGDQWQVARALHTKIPGATTWICSAGYGLVPLHSELRPYAATFATDQPDRVGDTTDKIQQWWEYLSTWRGPATNTPRSIASLASSDPKASLLVVLSSSYLRAIGRDLVDAAGHLRDPDQLSIISAGSTSSGPWDEYLIPTDANLQTSLGGSLSSLNVRIAGRLLEGTSGGPLSRKSLTEQLRKLRAASAKRPTLQRIPMTDTEVREFIVHRSTDKSTHSALLRQLRDSGYACEQSRFRQLFIETIGVG